MTDTPKVLDLFCGPGGAGMGYHHAGFDVVGVDFKPQPSYPFPFIQADVLGIKALGNFDLIHASPPCQAFTVYGNNYKNVNRDDHVNLIFQTRELLESSGIPYVMENVPRAPLIGHDRTAGHRPGTWSRTGDAGAPRYRTTCRRAGSGRSGSRSASTPVRVTGRTDGRSATSVSGGCRSRCSRMRWRHRGSGQWLRCPKRSHLPTPSILGWSSWRMGNRKARRPRKRDQRKRRRVMNNCSPPGAKGKVRYETEEEARGEARYVTALFGQPMEHYRCPTCDGWHTTKAR